MNIPEAKKDWKAKPKKLPIDQCSCESNLENIGKASQNTLIYYQPVIF
jgi:hypothetical protein